MKTIERFYNSIKGYTQVTVVCGSCDKTITMREQAFKKRKYDLCGKCYQKSPERKITSRKIVENRPSFDGKNNPNFKGKIDKICKCGKKFQVSKFREHTAKYCSYGCASSYRPHAIKHCQYKGIFFRSSWEMKFAQFLDSKSIVWNYEPKIFITSFGKYTPDFWVPEWNSFVEVKGYFRDDAQQKFEEFSKNNPIILANMGYLKNLGIDI